MRKRLKLDRGAYLSPQPSTGTVTDRIGGGFVTFGCIICANDVVVAM